MEKELDGDDVVVEISATEEKLNASDRNGEMKDEGIEKQESGSYSFKKVPSFKASGPSTIEESNVNPVTVLKADEDTNRRSMAQSPYPKAKSRLIEPAVPSIKKLEYDKAVTSGFPLGNTNPPKDTPPRTPRTPRTPLLVSPGEDDDDDHVYCTKLIEAKQKGKKSKKIKVWFSIELSLFVCITVVLVLSTTVDRLKIRIWSLELWKWCFLALVIFCGRLFSEWFTNTVVLLLEYEFLLKQKVLYFVYSLQKSVRIFIWLGLILLTWGLLINHGVHRSRDTIKALNYITRGIASTLVAAGAWIIKNLFVKILASSFHVKIFFDRIQEHIFHQYILQKLSGPPLKGDSESIPIRQVSYKSTKTKKGGKEKENIIDVQKLQKIKPGNVSAWTMKGLIKMISKSDLSTISNVLDESEDAEERNEEEKEPITCEWEAQIAGYNTFSNVAKHGHKYIEENDLLRFMKEDYVKKALPLFEGAVESGRIKKKAFSNWVVNVYKERKYLALSLKDTKTAIEELNKLASGFTLFVLIIVWLLLMGIATIEVLLFISSQLLLGIFMFGDSAKTAFEAIIFIFVIHPFDVGDRCVIDDVQVVVEEVNILTTVFLKCDNEKIYYPNSILATKTISNFNRSPEMSDSVEFDLDVSTSEKDILALRDRIKAYIESKPRLWRPKHSVSVKEIEDVNKMKMCLYVTHTINFQNYEEKSERVSNLVTELKNMCKELGIKYYLFPQQVDIKYAGSSTPPATTAAASRLS